MNTFRTIITTTIFTLGLAANAFADGHEEAEKLEQQQRQMIQSQFELIVESLNLGSFELFAGSIDKSDFLDRIYGLRLIDQGVKKNFTESMETRFASMVSNGFDGPKEAVQGVLLGIETRGDRGRAVVRYSLPNLQFSYHEYDLRLDAAGRLIIIDWVDYLRGQRFTDETGTALVQAMPSPRAARKLLTLQHVSESDLFQFTELLKAGRDRKTERYSDIYKNLAPDIQRQRVVVLMHVSLSRAVNNRRFLRQSLIEVHKYFPDEPLFALMLLDYTVPTKRYAEAIAGLQSAYKKLGFDDAAMEARISAITLVNGNSADAAAYAERAVLMEPSLELGWWSALRARAAISDFPGAVEALQQLEEHHGHTLGSAELERDKSFAALLASEEFKTWEASR